MILKIWTALPVDPLRGQVGKNKINFTRVSTHTRIILRQGFEFITKAITPNPRRPQLIGIQVFCYEETL